ncbi:MAG: toxic anion resistance protein [Tissierellia bacterium]|nr:toxic anion resistance protein [Tissierellia bacterium]
MNNEITMDALLNKKSMDERNPIVVETKTELMESPSAELTPEERAKVEEVKNSINFLNSNELVQYGVGAQRNISEFSGNILSNIKAKDSGEVGELMSDLMIKVKDLDIEEIGKSEGFLSKLPLVVGLIKSFEKFILKYQTLEGQIDSIEAKLDSSRMEMLKDISMFDSLYAKNLEYFSDLKVYIQAGEEKLAEMREEVLPKLKAEAKESGDQMQAQVVADFEQTINRFEKKIHDLKLSKTMAIQTAPQIRLIQNNDKLLVEKIQTTILNTIPLWKSQIVIAIGLYKQQNTLKLQKEVSDATNELLTKNSEMLKQSTIKVAKESERGIIDIETLKKVNRDLMQTIDETLKIQKDGRTKRLNAEKELIVIENDLKNKLLETRG